MFLKDLMISLGYHIVSKKPNVAMWKFVILMKITLKARECDI
jgi:hypothetical protein